MALGGIALVALLGAAWLGREEIAARWRYRTVRKLLDPAQREQIYRQVLGWRRYAASYGERFDDLPGKDEVIHRVFECPQREGPPLFVVAYRPFNGKPHIGHRGAPEYAFDLVDFDGTLIPVRDGMNVDPCELRDLNGDGVLELPGDNGWSYPDSWSTFRVFSLVAVTREQELLLRVAYREPSWTWEIHRSGEPPHAEIVLGPQGSEANQVEIVVARYRWDPAQGVYLGPAGGPEEDFVRASDFGSDRTRAWAELEPFARKQGER